MMTKGRRANKDKFIIAKMEKFADSNCWPLASELVTKLTNISMFLAFGWKRTELSKVPWGLEGERMRSSNKNQGGRKPW